MESLTMKYGIQVREHHLSPIIYKEWNKYDQSYDHFEDNDLCHLDITVHDWKVKGVIALL